MSFEEASNTTTLFLWKKKPFRINNFSEFYCCRKTSPFITQSKILPHFRAPSSKYDFCDSQRSHRDEVLINLKTLRRPLLFRAQGSRTLNPDLNSLTWSLHRELLGSLSPYVLKIWFMIRPCFMFSLMLLCDFFGGFVVVLLTSMMVSVTSASSTTNTILC